MINCIYEQQMWWLPHYTCSLTNFIKAPAYVQLYTSNIPEEIETASLNFSFKIVILNIIQNVDNLNIQKFFFIMENVCLNLAFDVSEDLTCILIFILLNNSETKSSPYIVALTKIYLF